MLRLYFPNGSLLIDHRAALTPARSLSCLASEDEVRRLLVVALTNPTSLDALRRFWANWHSEAKRVNVIDDRKLIDRIARMTVNGPLAAFAVYDRHAVHPGDIAQKLNAQQQGAAAGDGAPVAAHLANPGGSGSTTDEVNTLTTEQRLDQMLRRTPRYLPQALRAPFAKVLEREAMIRTVSVMTVWAKYREVSIGGILDALLLDGRRIDAGWTIVGAARKLHKCIEVTVEAREDKDLEAAARLLGEVLEEIRVTAFNAAIRHGADRVVSSPMKPAPAKRPPPVPPRLPQERLEERQAAPQPTPGDETKTTGNRIDIVFDPDKSKKVKKCEKIVHVQFVRNHIDGKVITGAEYSSSLSHKNSALTSTDGWTVDSLASETTPDYQQGTGDGKKNGGTTKAKMTDAPQTGGGDKGFYNSATNPDGNKKVNFEFVAFAYCMKGEDCGKWYEGVGWGYTKTWEDQKDGKKGESKITNNNVSTAPTKSQLEAFDKFNKAKGFVPCK